MQKSIGTEKFWIKHHTLKENLGKLKSGTSGYLMFVKKDVAPAVMKGAKLAMKEWKKGKVLSDAEIRKALKED